jgi:hypothetical protein
VIDRLRPVSLVTSHPFHIFQERKEVQAAMSYAVSSRKLVPNQAIKDV